MRERSIWWTVDDGGHSEAELRLRSSAALCCAPEEGRTPGEGTFYLVDCGMMEDTARQSRDCAARPLSVAPPRRDGTPGEGTFYLVDCGRWRTQRGRAEIAQLGRSLLRPRGGTDAR